MHYGNKNNFKSDNIKICYVIPSLNCGGAERQLVELVKRLNEQKYKPCVVCLQEKGKLAYELEKRGTKVISLKKGTVGRLRMLINLVMILRKEKPQIVHSYLYSGNLWGRIGAILSRTPIVVASIRGLTVWEKTIHIMLDEILGLFTSKIVGNCWAVVEHYQRQHKRVNPERLTVVYNGVDLERFCYDALEVKREKKRELGIDNSCKVVGIVANLAKNKDHRSFIMAASRVLKEFPDTIFLIVGGTQEKYNNHIAYESVSNLQLFAQELGCQNNIIFTGQRFDVPELLSTFDVSVLSSIHATEGFSNAIGESSAAGVPVVATNVCGNPEAVADGQTGFIIPQKDPDKMAEKILYLLHNSEEAIKLGRQGRLRTKRCFSVDNMVNNTERLYEELLKEGNGLL